MALRLNEIIGQKVQLLEEDAVIKRERFLGQQ